MRAKRAIASEASNLMRAGEIFVGRNIARGAKARFFLILGFGASNKSFAAN